jgi:ABC-type uncharacterized transport system permease subunit
VLNLGVEGMMVMGAVDRLRPSPRDRLALARLRPHRRGALFSLLFAFLTLTLVTNQVATGLALTLLRPRPVRHDRAKASSAARVKRLARYIPADCLPTSRCRPFLFGQDPIFYLSIAARPASAWFLFRTRAGLTCARSATITIPPMRSASRPVIRTAAISPSCSAAPARARRRLSLAGLYAACGWRT